MYHNNRNKGVTSVGPATYSVSCLEPRSSRCSNARTAVFNVGKLTSPLSCLRALTHEPSKNRSSVRFSRAIPSSGNRLSWVFFQQSIDRASTDASFDHTVLTGNSSATVLRLHF